MASNPIEVLSRRAGSGYQPGIDNDGHKIGITFEAGGYSSVISLAMASELDQAGLLSRADALYGLSSGAVNAAYAAADQITEGLDTYVRIMPDEKFASFRRGIKKPVVDISLLEKVLRAYHPLNTEKLHDENEVVFGLTRLEDRRALTTKTSRLDPDETVDWLLRGCHLPIVAGPAPTDGIYHYADAALSHYSSIHLAINDGCTEIVSLANQTARRHKVARPVGSLVGRWMNGYSIVPVPDFNSFCRKKTEALDEVSKERFVKAGVMVLRCYPEDTGNLPGLLTGDKERLRQAVAAGQSSVEEMLRENLA